MPNRGTDPIVWMECCVCKRRIARRKVTQRTCLGSRCQQVMRTYRETRRLAAMPHDQYVALVKRNNERRRLKSMTP